MVVRQGVISNVDTDITEETLKNRIKMFDYHCKFEVFSVKRITKTIYDNNTNEKILINTKSVIITFKSQTLPKYVAYGRVRGAVNPFIQRVILCYNCFTYGHSGA